MKGAGSLLAGSQVCFGFSASLQVQMNAATKTNVEFREVPHLVDAVQSCAQLSLLTEIMERHGFICVSAPAAKCNHKCKWPVLVCTGCHHHSVNTTNIEAALVQL